MEKINSFSLSTMLVGLSGASFWGILSSFLIHKSGNNIIIAMPIGFIISLILSPIILKFFSIEENASISNKFKIIFKKLSIVINIIFIILSLALFILLLYRLATFLSSQYLLKTPKLYLYFLVLLLTMYISSKGIETLSRLSILSFYIAVITFIFDCSSLIKNIDFNNFLPFMNISFDNTILSSIIFGLYFTVPTLYINVIKKDQLADKEKFNKYYYIYSFISFLILFLVIGTTIGIFGSSLSAMFDYPLYTILKRIEVFTFIESIENISISIWILYMVIATCTIMLTTINCIKDTFNIKKRKYILIMLFIISFIIPQIFFKTESLTNSYNYIYVPLIIGSIIFVILIVSILLYKKKT